MLHSSQPFTKKVKQLVVRFYRKRFTKRAVITIFSIAILCALGITVFETSGLLGGKTTAVTPGWIIDDNQLESLVGYSPSTLPEQYFNTTDTVVLNGISQVGRFVPNGWHSQPGNHYTSYGANSCTSNNDCFSLLSDLKQNKGTTTDQAPVALYDNEYWPRTPTIEQSDPCGYMDKFVATAHQHGLTTILAPDQDLAEPGVITSYQGNESENWQAYLRLGLAACAARSGSEWYHIMSQPFETDWCSNPFEECQSSESDYDNFVTQAALQAKAVNPSIKLSDGLSTNPDYFGLFRGTQAFARAIYQDYIDTQHVINAVWMNVVGRNGNLTALYFLSLLNRGSRAQPRSSVWFLEPNNMLRNSQSANTPTQTFALSRQGASQLFTSNQTLHAKTKIPTGTGEFQFWTDGSSTKSAEVNVTFGFCTAKNCGQQTVMENMNLWISGNAQGAAVADGAYTTNSATVLPSKGVYRLYVRLSVVQGASFDLLYGDNTPTNLSSPVVLPVR